ncbi:MAG: tetratricopeptide repeat protein [Betaproteobacteria bacterium]|nr:tetratricopeptide repeat protein [Betaproteobacteria bacterium]
MSLINDVLQDLEKRHASESELKTLPPYVRAVPDRPQSPLRMYVVTAVLVVVLIAVAFFISSGRRAPEDNAQQIASKPTAVLLPAPVPAAKVPVAGPPAQTATFNPVSRRSDELSLIGPLSARPEKPAGTGRNVKPGVARPVVDVVAAPLSRAEKPQAPDTVAKIEAVTKPTATTPERVAPPAAGPLAVAENAPGAIDKQMREVTPPERAEIAFRRGVTQLQEGRANSAELDFRDALKQDPSHSGARQALLGLLLDNGRNNEAEQLLRKALEINPRQPRHAMVLARLEVERGEVAGAINTMVGALPYVQSDPDFHAFLAALLQREGRHREAVDYYRAALRGVPGNGVWMMGLGISLRAANQSAEARDAFQHAIESRQLTPELQEFVERQLRELSAQKKK